VLVSAAGAAGPERHVTGSQLALSAVVVLAVVAIYGGYVRHKLRDDYHGNYSGFLQLGQDRFDDNPLVNDRPDIRRTLILQRDGVGYDGQFMYYMAFDPFMRRFDSYRRVVDYPPYRFGRIGFSLLTKLVSADDWRRYPAAMMGLIMSGVALSAAAVCALAVANGLSPVWGLVVVAIPGFWESVQLALPEPIAAGLLLAASACLVASKRLVAGLLLALSLLVRETGLVLVLCLVACQVIEGDRRSAWRFGLVGVLPLVAWRAYVASSQFGIYGAEALFVNPHDFDWPFKGVLDMWHGIAARTYYPGSPAVGRAGVWYPLVMTAGAALAVVLAIRERTAVAAAAVVYGGIAISLNFDSIWSGVGTGIRDTFELFVLLAAATVMRRRPPAWRVGLGIFWAASAAFVFFGAVDASLIRGVIASALGMG
jgi:hypothetical protein